MSLTIDVRVENVYEDDDDWPDAMKVEFDGAKTRGVTTEDLTVTVILEIEVDEFEVPSAFASQDDFETWADETIQPFTGIGKESGNAGYFAEIQAVDDDEYDYLVGRTFEWIG